MRPMRPLCCCVRSIAVTACLISSVPLATAGKIEAIQGKRYELRKQHGPWMIMVATFHAYDTEAQEGKPPEQAANDLVLELRQRNLPAYIYQVEGDGSVFDTVDERGRTDRKKNLRKLTTWGVLAGNYKSLEDPLGQDTLGYIKKLKPKCLDENSGVVWFAKAGEGPCRNAFLTPNPYLSAEEVAARSGVDPLLVQLNTGSNYSLLENKGEYTLQVAMFTGRRVMQGSTAARKSIFGNDDNKVNPLDAAAQEANDLAVALRQHRKIEAYVWHDHYQSIVTVGSFTSPNDPKMKATMDLFKEKMVVDEATGRVESKPEVFWINDRPDQPTRMWAFMPQPVTLPVPRIKPRNPQMARGGVRGATSR